MIRHRFNIILLVGVLALAGFRGAPLVAAESEQADQPAATARQTATAGICVFSRNAVFAGSIVGRKANKRMLQLTRQALGEVTQERKQLSKDIKTFSQKSATLLDQERQSRRQALRQRKALLQKKGKTIEARIRYTRDAVTKRLNGQINTVLEAVAKKRGCSLVLKRDSVVLGAQGRGLTDAVIKTLNDQIDMINFGLLQLPEPASGDNADGSAQ